MDAKARAVAEGRLAEEAQKKVVEGQMEGQMEEEGQTRMVVKGQAKIVCVFLEQGVSCCPESQL